MADVSVTVFDSGPIEVMGPITLKDENGNTKEIVEGEPIYLCRCGVSKDKPYCDGSHGDCGFVHKYTE